MDEPRYALGDGLGDAEARYTLIRIASAGLLQRSGRLLPCSGRSYMVEAIDEHSESHGFSGPGTPYHRSVAVRQQTT